MATFIHSTILAVIMAMSILPDSSAARAINRPNGLLAVTTILGEPILTTTRLTSTTTAVVTLTEGDAPLATAESTISTITFAPAIEPLSTPAADSPTSNYANIGTAYYSGVPAPWPTGSSGTSDHMPPYTSLWPTGYPEPTMSVLPYTTLTTQWINAEPAEPTGVADGMMGKMRRWRDSWSAGN